MADTTKNESLITVSTICSSSTFGMDALSSSMAILRRMACTPKMVVATARPEISAVPANCAWWEEA